MSTSVTYEEFERAEMNKAKAEQDSFAAARRQAVEEEIRQLAAAAKTTETAKVAQTRQTRRQTAARFTEEYSKNALQHAVTRRQWQQRLAELGLHDSGLQKTGRRVADGEKAAADASTSGERQQELSALAQSLSTWQAQQEADQQEEAAKLRAAAEKEIAQNETALYKAAKTRATSQYKAALSAAAKGVKAT